MTRLYPTLFLSLLLPLAACPAEGDIDEAEDTTLTVTLERTVDALGGDNDGVGTAYVIALAECDLAAAVLGAAALPDADFGQRGARASVDIPALPVGETAHLAAFLDDDLDADPQAPIPDPGDLVYATTVGDGILSCVEAIVGDDPPTVPLNAVRPE